MSASALITALVSKCARKPLPPEVRDRAAEAKERAYRIITGSPLPKSGNGTSPAFMKRFFKGDSMRKIIIGGAVSVCVLAIAAGAGFFLSGKKEAIESRTGGTIVFVVGDVTLVKADGKAETAKTQGHVVSGDTIKTGKGSFATVQVSEQGNLKVNENTVLAFARILENSKTSLVVSQGSVYSKLKKMDKGSSYEVKTPVYVAAVRGTEFLASYDGAKGTIHVADGKVAMVASPKAGEAASAVSRPEEIVSAKEGAVVFKENKVLEPEIQRYSLNKKQMLELQRDSIYTSVDNSAVADSQKFAEVQTQLKQQENVIASQIMVENNMTPIERLRSENKPLTMVYMRDGSQITGSLVSSDETNMSLDTGEGIIKLPVKEIIRRVPIK
jgi:hypothetical protein